jgi:hypothetical protein
MRSEPRVHAVRASDGLVAGSRTRFMNGQLSSPGWPMALTMM